MMVTMCLCGNFLDGYHPGEASVQMSCLLSCWDVYFLITEFREFPIYHGFKFFIRCMLSNVLP